MSELIIIFAILLGVMIFALIIITSVLYGMDLGIGYCDNFVDWVKKTHKFNKEWNEEQKAKQAFLKANPLCVECQKNGKYRKSTCCNQEGVVLIPVCQEHYISQFERHRQEKEDLINERSEALSEMQK